MKSARTMTRSNLPAASEGELKLIGNAPVGTQADSPNAVLLDELEGLPDPNEQP